MRRELQYLRAVAALLVVYFHAVLQVPSLNGGTESLLPKIGECGVDIFFVLSGAVMWLSTAGKTVTLRAFLLRRLVRILPLYWAVTLVAAAIALLAPSLLKSTVFDLPLLLSSLAFLPHVNPSIAPEAGLTAQLVPFVVPGWTLNYEMFFYVLFALSLRFAEWMRPIAVLGFLLFFALLGLGMPGLSFTHFYGNGIIFEFVAGMMVAQDFTNGIRWQRSVAVSFLFAGFVMMIIADLFGGVVARPTVFGLPAVLIVCGTLALSRHAAEEDPLPLLTRLGNASYSLYITHFFVLSALREVLKRVPVGILHSDIVFIGLSLIIASAVSMIVYDRFEHPLVTWLGKRLSGSAPAEAKVAAAA